MVRYICVFRITSRVSCIVQTAWWTGLLHFFFQRNWCFANQVHVHASADRTLVGLFAHALSTTWPVVWPYLLLHCTVPCYAVYSSSWIKSAILGLELFLSQTLTLKVGNKQTPTNQFPAQSVAHVKYVVACFKLICKILTMVWVDVCSWRQYWLLVHS